MKREETSAVYIVASGKHGTLYIGVTTDLVGRISDHREGRTPGFTKTYGCKRLVWYEPYGSISAAIQREKSLKRWPREWKLNLIERDNPTWDDLYETFFKESGPLSSLSPKITPSS